MRTYSLVVAVLLAFCGWADGRELQDVGRPPSPTEGHAPRQLTPPRGNIHGRGIRDRATVRTAASPAARQKELFRHLEAKKYGRRVDVPPARPPRPKPLPEVRRRRTSAAAESICSPAGFAEAEDVAEAIATSTSECISELWAFDSDTATVISEENVVTVSDAIEDDAGDLVSNLDRVTNLVLFLQIAFYHEFYESTVSYGPGAYSAAQNSLLEVRASAGFMDETAAASGLRHQWAISIDSTNGTILALDTVEALLVRYHTDPSLASIHEERGIVYSCFFSIQRQIGNNKSDESSSPWYSAIQPSLLAVVSDIALDVGYGSDTEFLITNALWLAGHFSLLDTAASDAGHSILSTATTLFDRNTAPWLWGVRTLEEFYSGVLADGTPLDMDQIRSDVLTIALPNRFEFDQGRLVFITGVDLATAKHLYDALKEVRSQFFRVTTFLNPVPDDTNEALNLTVYASRPDYELYHPFLFNLGTDSGGIFIEGDGTLYTYERTPEESIYTLEELLRHEYVHYLDSRFVIVGLFGQAGTLYDDNRLVWYIEGLAEFLVGSTRASGVLPRGTLVNSVKSDTVRLSVPEITSSAYGNFTFYRYAGLLFTYLHENRPDLLTQLFHAVRSNDKAVFDPLVASLSNEGASYGSFLDHIIIAYDESTRTFAEEVPTTPTPPDLTVGDPEDIRVALLSETPTQAGRFRIWPDRFLYSDHLSVDSDSVSQETVWEQLDQQLDDLLLTLTPLRHEFASAVAWFGNMQAIGEEALVRYAVEGPLKLGADDGQAPDAPGGLAVLQTGGGRYLRWVENDEPDISGYNVYAGSTAGGPYQRINTAVFPIAEYRDRSERGGDIHYVVTAVDAWGNESGHSAEAFLTVPVLIVNGYFDDGVSLYTTSYAGAFDGIGIPYSVWDPFTDGPITWQVLAPYTDGVVIWAVGYLHAAYPDQLDAAKQALLASYLDAGGSVVFSGAYTASNLETGVLFSDYFFVNHVKNLDLTQINGIAGHPIGDGLVLSIGGYQSEIDVGPGATAALVYDPSSGTDDLQSSGTAVATVDSTYRVAYMGFPFGDLDDAGQTALLTSIMSWMLPDACAGADTDGDGRPDACDACAGFDDLADIDRDGAADGCDAFPLDAAAQSDTDGDGMPDKWETDNGLDPVLPGDASEDADGDGVSNHQEFVDGTDPRDAASYTPPTGSIAGRIVTMATGYEIGVRDAVISIVGTRHTTHSLADGTFSLTDIPYGGHMVSITAPYFRPHTAAVALDAGVHDLSVIELIVNATAIPGDVNGDGQVGLDDAIRALQILSGMRTE